MTASKKTRTPMPPTQCVKLRQKSEQWESVSTLFKTLAPVVVKPEMVSNKASGTDVISPVSKNGMEPKKLSTIQLKDVATQPSFK